MRALQEFTGAMVIVSHDRHFLRATVDDFYLVAKQRVEAFGGTLEDYHVWVETERAEAKVAARNESAQTSSADDRLNKKEQRQAAADRRKQLKPLLDKIKTSEKKMQVAETKLAELHDLLSDTELYDASRKDELTTLLKQQSDFQQQLEDAEAHWLMYTEELEQLESDT